jgi:hypothetical protein
MIASARDPLSFSGGLSADEGFGHAIPRTILIAPPVKSVRERSVELLLALIADDGGASPLFPCGDRDDQSGFDPDSIFLGVNSRFLKASKSHRNPPLVRHSELETYGVWDNDIIGTCSSEIKRSFTYCCTNIRAAVEATPDQAGLFDSLPDEEDHDEIDDES